MWGRQRWGERLLVWAIWMNKIRKVRHRENARRRSSNSKMTNLSKKRALDGRNIIWPKSSIQWSMTRDKLMTTIIPNQRLRTGHLGLPIQKEGKITQVITLFYTKKSYSKPTIELLTTKLAACVYRKLTRIAQLKLHRTTLFQQPQHRLKEGFKR